MSDEQPTILGLPTPTFPHTHTYVFAGDRVLYQLDDQPPVELLPSEFLTFLQLYVEQAERTS